MKPSVYIETTFPSFYYEVRPEPEMATRRHWICYWWDNHRSNYELLTSDAVADELERGDFPNRVVFRRTRVAVSVDGCFLALVFWTWNHSEIERRLVEDKTRKYARTGQRLVREK